MTYTETYVTASELGGFPGGDRCHRVYDGEITREERRELLRSGWRPVDLSSGRYAKTTVVSRAKEVCDRLGRTWINDLVWIDPLTS